MFNTLKTILGTYTCLHLLLYNAYISVSVYTYIYYYFIISDLLNKQTKKISELHPEVLL